MRVQLGILGAGQFMAKSRGNQIPRAFAKGQSVLLPARSRKRLQQLQALRDGRVMRRDDALVAHHQCLNAHRLGRAEGEVDALAILAAARAARAQALPIGQMGIQHLPERFRRDGQAGFDPQRGCARAHPFTAMPFLAVVVVGILEVVRGPGRAGDELEGKHAAHPQACEAPPAPKSRPSPGGWWRKASDITTAGATSGRALYFIVTRANG